MNKEKVRQGIDCYIRSRFSVADDDRLKELVREIPVGIVLNINAMDTDSIGMPCSVHMRVVKTESNSWRVESHWAFKSGASVFDSMISHSLVYILRCKRLSVIVDEISGF